VARLEEALTTDYETAGKVDAGEVPEVALASKAVILREKGKR
jgi:hypothetical protein